MHELCCCKEPKAKMLKIKVAIIGAGYMAAEHMKAFADIEAVTIAGIFSRTRSKAENLAAGFPGTLVCDSIEELYHKTHAEIVIITASITSVKNISAQCFQYPWACFFEKPLGLNLEEAIEIHTNAELHSANAFVLLNRRHYASTAMVMEDMMKMDGSRLIHVQDQEDINAQLEAGTPQPIIDNWMYANAIHLVDYFSFLGRGGIKKVENIVKWDPAHPGFVIASILYESGDIGMYEAVWNAPGPWAVSITTHARRWEMKPLEQAAYQDYRSRTWVPMVSVSEDNRFKPGLRKQAQEVVNAATGKTHSLPTFAEALDTMRLVSAIYRR